MKPRAEGEEKAAAPAACVWGMLLACAGQSPMVSSTTLRTQGRWKISSNSSGSKVGSCRRYITLSLYSVLFSIHMLSGAKAAAHIIAQLVSPKQPLSRAIPRLSSHPFSRFNLNLVKRAMSASAAAKRLEGKTIVITGASSGIGKSCAFEFARTSPKNLKLILTARRIDTLKEVAAEIQKEVGDGVKVLPVQLDVSKPEEVRQFVPKLPEEFRDIHVLVNNAGLVKGLARAPEIAEEDMNTMFNTNVTGLINMTQAILPIFKSRRKEEGGAGDVINVGSIAGREPYAGGSIYCATKAAVRSFSDSLRKETVDSRIRVIEIDPGQVETEFSVVRFYGDAEKAKKVYEGVEPLTPDDIAEVVVFAASRRENVVIADTLVFPSHQVSLLPTSF
ncbi:hypothetical protein DL546_006353 [Coniochaeta pulveracea]|uniref:Oxidoreductase n=1 Tax=Coniochaeta pulveracea TaxID=177199 RepID=A0A420YD43_9PEZI|nr:hypothetical protein DL546_006353 [Coniochaeta pulveracea]